MFFSCGICKELFVPGAVVLTTICGHLYHSDCLEKWQKRSQHCPQCRSITSQNPHRVYFDLEDRTELPNNADSAFLICQREELLETVRQRDRENEELKTNCSKMESLIDELQERLQAKEKISEASSMIIRDLKKRVASLNEEKKEIVELREANAVLKAKVTTMKLVEEAIHTSEDKIHEQLKKTPLTHLALQQLVTLTEVLKGELARTNEKHLEQVKFYKLKCRELSQKVDAKKVETCSTGTQTSSTSLEMMARLKKYTDESTLLNRKTDDISTSPPHGAREVNGKKKEFSFTRKVINNLERKVLSSSGNTSDSSDCDIIYPYPTKSALLRSSAGSTSGSSTIFKRGERISGTNAGIPDRYEPCFSWGRMRNPLATPTPAEELHNIRYNKVKGKSSKSQAHPYARASTTIPPAKVLALAPAPRKTPRLYTLKTRSS